MSLCCGLSTSWKISSSSLSLASGSSIKGVRVGKMPSSSRSMYNAPQANEGWCIERT